MARVRRSGTEPELVLRQALWAGGLRYRLKSKVRLPGKPDILFPGSKVAVFVDGCFWHGCPLHGTTPKTNADFWVAKIKRNQSRDVEVDAKLIGLGWKVVRLWEHDIKCDLKRVVNHISVLVSDTKM
jgi:DNA mismatch endonuclease (patch repair protein)